MKLPGSQNGFVQIPIPVVIILCPADQVARRCLQGMSQRLRNGDYNGAKEYALTLSEIFGPEHFYLELQDHGIRDQAIVNKGILRLHEEMGLPLVVTNDAHYLRKEDAYAHDVLLCIQTAAGTC